MFEDVVAETEIPGGGADGTIPITLHCHHQNDSCIQMGSDASHFNVSLTVMGKDGVHKPHTFEDREEPKRNLTEVFQLTSLMP